MRASRWQALKKLAILIGLILLWQGLGWAESENNWFAVVGSFRDLKQAKTFAQRMQRTGYEPEIYLAENNYYAVTIGSSLDYKEARKLVEQARKSGIAQDAYVWQSDLWKRK
jgi:cell division protein FtsN